MLWQHHPDERLRALASVPGLDRLSSSGRRRLLRHFDEVDMEGGAVLARAGQPSTELLVVIEGRLEVTGSSGTASLGAGEAWGWEAMAERGVNPATVVTGTRSRLLVMGRAQFRALAGLAPPAPPPAPAPQAVSRAS